MANSFTKQEMVAWEEMVEGFDDYLVISKGATKFMDVDPQKALNTRDKFWLPAPMIGRTYDGSDATGHFGDVTDINVPVSVGFWKHSSKAFSATDLRSQYAMDKWKDSAKQKLASDVNLSLFNRAALEGGTFAKMSGAPGSQTNKSYDDVADLDTRFARIGVPTGDRMAFYAPSVMNKLAGDLAVRSENTTRSSDAYERARIRSDVAGFEVFKNDQEILLSPATGGAILINGANQRTVPAATTIGTGGEEENKDNRYTDLIVDGGTYANIKNGDAFTIAGVNSVHMITKQDSGQLKTFRVVGKPAANTIRVYPAIIFGTTDAEVEYQSVSALPADNAAFTWLNTVSAPMNPFFVRESLLLIPGSFEIEDGAGVMSMSATTDMGITIKYSKATSIDTLLSKCRFDIRWGTALTNPEMAGCQMFGQS